MNDSLAWVRWSNLYWTKSPPIHVNTATPEVWRPFVSNSLAAWIWSGSYYYPYYAGLTGRDCGDGDAWGSDDDDGYNVIDYATSCNNGHSMSCDGANASTHVIDLFNTNTAVVAEMDIVMCSNNTYSGSWSAPGNGSVSYQAILTHELGHLMCLSHTQLPPNTIKATMHTSADLGTDGAYIRSSLSSDDVLGVRSIYGACSNNEWVIENTSGHNVTKGNNYICGVNMSLYPRGTGATWTAPVTFRQNRLGAWVKENTYVEWEEYDRNHSLILALTVVGLDGIARELNYARNASNWWSSTGWLGPQNVNNVPNFNGSYFSWVRCRGNIMSDYIAEYGVGALAVTEFRIKHFAYTGWNQGQDHGGGIRDVVIHRW